MSEINPVGRRVAAALLLVTGGAHVPLIREHLHEAPYIGWGFVLLSLTCLVLATWLWLSDSTTAWLLSGVVCTAALLAFVASRTIGLPQIGDDVGNWTEPMGFPAVASEALVAILAITRLRSRTSTQRVMSARG
jgi:MFS superfamily sulfate permease-like transporter